jgi:cytochrome c
LCSGVSIRTLRTQSLHWRSFAIFAALVAACATNAFAIRVLVFSKVADDAYRHSSIPNGIAAIHEIGVANGWQVDDTIDARAFNPKSLAKYDVIVWNNTGGDILDDGERTAFEDFIHHGGGFVGVHEAAPWAGSKDVSWPWYEGLVGAHFKQHPEGTRTANVTGASGQHPSTKGIPNPWSHTDEWYEWIEDPSPARGMHILLYVDEKSYGRGTGQHPVAWCHEYEGGRAFYTALGHTEASYGEADFRTLLAGGIEWASARSPNLTADVKNVRKRK